MLFGNHFGSTVFSELILLDLINELVLVGFSIAVGFSPFSSFSFRLLIPRIQFTNSSKLVKRILQYNEVK